MKRLTAVIALTGALFLAAPGAVVAHSQLISSSPGASEILVTTPPEIRMAFSEPIEAEYTSFSITDENGEVLAAGLGAPDPEDPYTMVQVVDEMPTGGYTISWQALSQADGHTSAGFFSFGIGAAVPGDVHTISGHGVDANGVEHPAPGLLADWRELAGRTLAYLGLFIAFGLLPIGLLVVKPAYGRLPRPLVVSQATALVIGTFGAILLAAMIANRTGLDIVTYLTGSRTGELILYRIAIGLIATLVVIGLLAIRFDKLALWAGGLGSAAALYVLALSGHASAFASPGPMAAMLVHLSAAAVWLTGVVVLVVLAFVPNRPSMRKVVPRFSALALVSIGLVAATGIYADWVQTRNIFSVETDYQLTLAFKIGLVVLALGIGALNFFDAGRERSWLGGFRTRIVVETGVIAMILLATANLGSGFPPSSQAPIPIAETVSSSLVASERTTTLEVGPGRPGLNRFVVTIDPAPPEFTAVTIDLSRLDVAGSSKIYLKPAIDDVTGRTFFSDGGLLPRDSRWEITVAATDESSRELTHSRYEFGLDDTRISAGRQEPPLDPGLAIGFLLICASVLGGIYALAGGSLPKVQAKTGRIALAGGGAIGSMIGLILVVFGTRI